MPKTVVVALGGNAIIQPKQKGTAAEQRENIQTTARQISALVRGGYRVIVTHGNGPQVGNILIQQEEGAGVVPPMPLDVCGAKSQGYLGYMLQQALSNELKAAGLDATAVTIVTQVAVDPQDKAFADPTKPVGPFYTEERARELEAAKGWRMKEDAGRGWRRVVASPDPKRIVEAEAIRAIVRTGAVVIACGGGGIPVHESAAGLSGLEAVIDKDLAGERLAQEVEADILLILTDVEQAAINYRQPGETWLGTITVAEARRYQAEGHFRAGSMGPKMEAAVRFTANGGEFALITSLDKATAALAGRTGTRIVP
ncbi:MAG: carbamate kinase [Bacillota bacterium]